VLNFFIKISSVFLVRKKKNRGVRDNGPGRANQPVFTSRFAQQKQRRVGLFSRIQSWLQRSARRKKMALVPGLAGSRTKALFMPLCLLALAVSLICVAYGPLMNMVSGLNLFKIREVTITGCRITTPALIRELAGIRYQSSMMMLKPGHIKAILKAHPWIAEVEIKRQWPNALVISVKEHVIEALILQEVAGSKKFFYLDNSGVVFAPVEPGEDMDFPVITGLEVNANGGAKYPVQATDTKKSAPPGLAADADAIAMQGVSRAMVLQEMLREPLAFLKLVRQNNPNLPIQNLSEIHVDREAGMTLYLVDYPFPIYFGKGEIRTKYSRLKRVLEVLYKDTGQGMTIADVAYIRMDYLENKVLVAHSGSG
jgi:cell division protein FtsQ